MLVHQTPRLRPADGLFRPSWSRENVRPMSPAGRFMPAFPEPDDALPEPDGDSFESRDATGLDDVLQPDGEAGAEIPGDSSDSYWTVSRRPLTSLVFTLPLVLGYEGGVLLLGRGTPRNGADVWLRHLLDAAGFGSYFLLPVLTAVALVAWHHIEHERWTFRPGVLLGMAGECTLWAAGLIGIARLQERIWPLAAGAVPDGFFRELIGYCGAGLYEEVLFRLLLMPLLIWVCERLGAPAIAACGWGILLSSLLFSAAHYVGPLGDAFALYSFTFRTIAGGFFAVLFLVRGFGIAAGTHFLYDLFIGLM